ncbi:MAG: 16S rRNA (guanine(527)-N(7))-methyltransferase RsmG [Methylophilaceae bacterium]
MADMPSNLNAEARAMLHTKLLAGLAEMSLILSVEKQEKLLNYVALIYKWNQVHNLTAVREPLDMITLHILDSLSIMPYVESKRLLDVGAGAGLPSIPLAICLPELQVTAIDAVQKKVTFMRQVKAELQLANFVVIHGRIEDQVVPSKEIAHKYEIIASRAFSEISLFVKLTKHLLADKGKWLAMKGLIPQQEFEKSGIRPSEIKVLKVAGLEAERHLIIIENSK